LTILEVKCDEEFFDQLRFEAGGHRLQRIPPTERKGRVHTSTVTVAIIDTNSKHSDKYLQRADSDFKVEWFSGTGAGGQNRNKVQNSCRLIHIPTGLVETAQTRDRSSSYQTALTSLNTILDRQMHGESHSITASERKSQVGSGMRGDKIRTYRFQDNITTDHRNEQRGQTTKILNGYFDVLWR
jgi:peptide chain release factor 1